LLKKSPMSFSWPKRMPHRYPEWTQIWYIVVLQLFWSVVSSFHQSIEQYAQDRRQRVIPPGNCSRRALRGYWRRWSQKQKDDIVEQQLLQRPPLQLLYFFAIRAHINSSTSCINNRNPVPVLHNQSFCCASQGIHDDTFIAPTGNPFCIEKCNWLLLQLRTRDEHVQR